MDKLTKHKHKPTPGAREIERGFFFVSDGVGLTEGRIILFYLFLVQLYQMARDYTTPTVMINFDTNLFLLLPRVPGRFCITFVNWFSDFISFESIQTNGETRVKCPSNVLIWNFSRQSSSGTQYDVRPVEHQRPSPIIISNQVTYFVPLTQVFYAIRIIVLKFIVFKCIENLPE